MTSEAGDVIGFYALNAHFVDFTERFSYSDRLGQALLGTGIGLHNQNEIGTIQCCKMNPAV